MLIEHPYLFSFGFLVVAGLFFSLPAFKFLDTADSHQKNHNHAMDSLRYFLASFVFMSHSVRMMGFVKDGTWKGTVHEFNYLAVLGVSLFFAITAVLFWGKIKDQPLDFIKLYKNRIFRIVPLIWFNSIAILIVTCLLSKSAPNLNFLYWLDPLNNSRPDFNAFNGSWALTGGVFWTLVYEWGFYFCLPLLFIFRRYKLETSITLVFLMLYISSYLDLKINFGVIMPFMIGMLAIDIAERVKINRFALNIALITSIFSLLYFMPRLQNVSSIANLFMLIIMICVIKNADMFGFLKVKGFQRLGAASYSIYVMHAMMLYIIFKLANKYDILANYPITTMVASYSIILIVSALTYRFVETVFINIGRKVNF